MLVIDERCASTLCGRILYDASQLRKPEEAVFSLEYWSAKDALEQSAGGRGSIALIRNDEQRWVLRHYQRGGLAARISQDRYVWCGERATRSFAEWRLLAELCRMGLPVPRPIAARYVRSGWTYSADLITELLPDVITLADAITDADIGERRWREIGRTIAAFHAQGVHHADLNAHNVMLRSHRSDASAPSLQPDAQGPCESHGAHGSASVAPVYLLDFDRGRIRPRGAWEQQVLARLKRSLQKIRTERPSAHFDEAKWGWLVQGYEACGERRTADGGR